MEDLKSTHLFTYSHPYVPWRCHVTEGYLFKLTELSVPFIPVSHLSQLAFLFNEASVVGNFKQTQSNDCWFKFKAFFFSFFGVTCKKLHWKLMPVRRPSKHRGLRCGAPFHFPAKSLLSFEALCAPQPTSSFTLNKTSSVLIVKIAVWFKRSRLPSLLWKPQTSQHAHPYIQVTLWQVPRCEGEVHVWLPWVSCLQDLQLSNIHIYNYCQITLHDSISYY